MTKLEYLGKLEQHLQKVMPQKEVNDIVRDYAEYFEEGKQQNKNDDEIAAKLGNPQVVAEQILEENGYDIGRLKKKLHTKVKETSQKMDNFSFGKALRYCLAFLVALFLVPVLVIGVFAVAALIFSLFLVAFGFLMVALALGVAAICIMITSGIFFTLGIPVAGAVCVIMGVGSLALTVCLCSLGIMAIIWLCKKTNAFCRWSFHALFAPTRDTAPTQQPSNEEVIIHEQA